MLLLYPNESHLWGDSQCNSLERSCELGLQNHQRGRQLCVDSCFVNWKSASAWNRQIQSQIIRVEQEKLTSLASLLLPQLSPESQQMSQWWNPMWTLKSPGARTWMTSPVSETTWELLWLTVKKATHHRWRCHDWDHLSWRCRRRHGLLIMSYVFYPFQVSEPFKPITVNGLRYYVINGVHLEPSTTYLVSVRSVYWNNVTSDSSEEVEFTTRECRLYGHFVSFYAAFCIFLCRTSPEKVQRPKIKV